MDLRIVASRALAAFAVAGFASAAVPAQAQAQVACGYPCAYVVPQPQYQCGSCGNRGLFTSTWVQPCGYNPCQQAVYQPQYYQPQYYQPQYAPAPQYYAPEQQYTDGYYDDGVGYGPYRYRQRTIGTYRGIYRGNSYRRNVSTIRLRANRVSYRASERRVIRN
jgi:hypothetical protein